MSLIKNGHFSKKRNGHNTKKSYIDHVKHKFFGIDTAVFINSIADEQCTFTRKEDGEKVRELLTYFICRVKERMSAGPKIEE